MAASLEEIQRILSQIRDELPALVQRSQIAPQQIVIGEGLSDIDKRMGLLQAGEFRAGNGVEPGLGFSGVRIGYPAFLYESSLWHIAGVNNDTLQFGLRASDGVAIFGGMTISLSSSGIQINADAASGENFITWFNNAGTVEALVGAIGANLEVGIENISPTGQAQLELYAITESAFSFITLYADEVTDVTSITHKADTHYFKTEDGAAVADIATDGINIESGKTYQINGATVVSGTVTGVTNGDSHNHVGGDGATLTYLETLAAHGQAATIPASTTYWTCPFITGMQTTEAGMLYTKGGTARNLTIRIVGTQPASGSLVCTLRVNGADTALVVTIPAGSGAGNYSDTSNTVAINDNDRIGWKLVNNATAASAAIGATVVQLDRNTT